MNIIGFDDHHHQEGKDPTKFFYTFDRSKQGVKKVHRLILPIPLQDGRILNPLASTLNCNLNTLAA